METLNSDEKMSILMKLAGAEIVKVCETSKTMQKICKDERYARLWKQKIWEEFENKYDGNNGYEKYKELTLLYRTTFYVVNFIDSDQAEDSFSILFDTREKAEIYIYTLIAPDYTYARLKTALKVNNSLRLGNIIYSIHEEQLKKEIMQQNISDATMEYEKMQEKFRNLYKEDEFANEITHAVNDIIIDINNDSQGRFPKNIKKNITKEVKKLSKEFEIVSKNETEFINYIFGNIFIPTELQD